MEKRAVNREDVFRIIREARKSGERADLSGADLSCADLYGADLCGADLSGADLYGANLSGATLPGADLYGANLSGANLSGAYLSGANMHRANLSGADLSGATLSRVDLSCAVLPRTFIDLGFRIDGHHHHAFFVDGSIRIIAGCRNFRIDQARNHWSNHVRGKRCALCAESLAKLDMAEAVAKARGWELKK